MKPNLKKLQAECDEFNASNPVGTKVLVQLDGRDEAFETLTRSEAQILSGHSAVIWLEKVSGCYLLERVTQTPAVAWAWSSGLIEIGGSVPDGAIKIAEGRFIYLKAVLEVLARQGKGDSAGKLFVSGIPEAETQKTKGDALAQWLEFCAKGNGKKYRYGVVFMTEGEST